ncbi:MAG: YccF domain-containing protein [Hyphomicrobiales bacterium]
MSLLNFALNVIWFFTGGIWMGLGWALAGVLMAITIIGLPWTRAAFNIAGYTFMPFGRMARDRSEVTGEEDFGTGALGFIGNILWLILAGWWLAIGHVVTAVALGITIIGIPFAWAHLKFAALSLWPIGKTIVSSDVYELTRIKSLEKTD